MKKLLILTTTLVIMCATMSQAQDLTKKKKPGFTLNEQAMTELSVTSEQKQKIEENKVGYREEIKKIQSEGTELDNYCQRRIDSVLTEPQKQKVAALKTVILTQNKENLAVKRIFVYDQKTMDELGLTPDQQKKITALKGDEQVRKWKHGQKMNKVMTEYFTRENALLTDVQQKKVIEIKAAIADYNKGIQ